MLLAISHLLHDDIDRTCLKYLCYKRSVYFCVFRCIMYIGEMSIKGMKNVRAICIEPNHFHSTVCEEANRRMWCVLHKRKHLTIALFNKHMASFSKMSKLERAFIRRNIKQKLLNKIIPFVLMLCFFLFCISKQLFSAFSLKEIFLVRKCKIVLETSFTFSFVPHQTNFPCMFVSLLNEH